MSKNTQGAEQTARDYPEAWRTDNVEKQELRDRIEELEYYNLGLANESCAQQARIAELEAACEKAEYERDWHSDELRTLEAENARLREALEIIAGKRQCIDNLMGNIEIAEAALLNPASDSGSGG